MGNFAVAHVSGLVCALLVSCCSYFVLSLHLFITRVSNRLGMSSVPMTWLSFKARFLLCLLVTHILHLIQNSHDYGREKESVCGIRL